MPLRGRRGVSAFRSTEGGGCLVHEPAVHPSIASDLGVKGDAKDAPLPCRYDSAVFERRNGPRRGTNLYDLRCANEHGVDLSRDPRYRGPPSQGSFQRLQLSPEGVAPNLNIKEGENGLIAIGNLRRKQDRPSTGTQDWRAALRQRFDWLH